MRHRKNFNHLSRKTGHRKSMLANMASSLILHKRIQTTKAKAKALRIFVEPLITKSKEDSTNSRRVVFSHLQNKEAVTELFREVSPKIAERPGGYTRILKTGTRLGDNAEMCVIELVDYNENLLTAKEEAAAKSGRRRRRGGKKKPTEVSAQIEEATVVAGAEDKGKIAKDAAKTSVEEPVNNEAEEVGSVVEEKADSSEEDAIVEAKQKTEKVKEEPKEETKAIEEEKKSGSEIKAEDAKSEKTEAKTEEKEEDKQDENKKDD